MCCHVLGSVFDGLTSAGVYSWCVGCFFFDVLGSVFDVFGSFFMSWHVSGCFDYLDMGWGLFLMCWGSVLFVLGCFLMCWYGLGPYLMCWHVLVCFDVLVFFTCWGLFLMYWDVLATVFICEVLGSFLMCLGVSKNIKNPGQFNISKTDSNTCQHIKSRM